jgi:hypothetical protein
VRVCRRRLVSGRELAGALGDVQDDAQGRPLKLIGQITTSSGQALDDVVRLGDELDGQLIDVELLVVERHEAHSLLHAAINSMTC